MDMDMVVTLSDFREEDQLVVAPPRNTREQNRSDAIQVAIETPGRAALITHSLSRTPHMRGSQQLVQVWVFFLITLWVSESL